MNFIDDFNRADNPTSLGTPSDGGPAYEVLSGVWGIVSNNGFCTPSGSNLAVVRDAESSDGFIEAIMSDFGSVDFGLVARAQDNSNYLLAVVTSGPVFRLYKQVAGSFTQINSAGGTAVTGAPFALECIGTTVKVYDTTMTAVITETVSEFSSATKWGMREFAGGARWNRVMFYDSSPPDGGGGGGAASLVNGGLVK